MYFTALALERHSDARARAAAVAGPLRAQNFLGTNVRASGPLAAGELRSR